MVDSGGIAKNTTIVLSNEISIGQVYMIFAQSVVHLLKVIHFYRTRVRSLAMLVTHSLTH